MAEIRVLEGKEKGVPVLTRLRYLMDALKIQESLFALPLAYTAMLIAANGFPTWSQFIWITIAMVGARNFGMALNRVIDRDIDASNPKTRDRHLPAGRTKVWEMLVLVLVALALFLVSAWWLNPLAFALAWAAAAYLLIYSYLKRFTWTANLALGWALAIGPAGAWIAVTGTLTWQMFLLAFAIFSWASAFDILHHLPSRDFYIEQGLHSIPQKFGIRVSLFWSRTHDLIAISALLALGIWMRIEYPYFVGVALAALVIAYKHTLLIPYEPSKIGGAFFRYNAIVSALIMVFTFVAIVL